MTVVNSTAEFWDVDGMSLNEMTQNLVSWGGDREAAPDLRGSNQVIPYRPGARWVAKMPDQRDIQLEGWMTADSETELRARWRAFRALLWRPDEQFVLTRRWLEGGVLTAATAMVEYQSGMQPVISRGGRRAEFKVTLRLADPFFYGDPVTVTLPVGDTPFVPLGDYPSRKVKVVLNGTQTNARLSVMTGTSIDNTLTYSAVAASTVATVDVDAFKATEVVGGGTVNSNGKVSHTGRPTWVHLPMKTTKLRLARDAGTGTVQITYQPAWH